MVSLFSQWYKRKFSDPNAVTLLVILLCAFLFVFFFNNLLMPVFVAIAIAFLLDLPVYRLMNLGLSRTLSVSFVVVVFIGISLVAILDADKEGFLRSQRSLTQTVGRAARHEKGKAIFYADRITNSMQLTMDDTDRKRSIQMKYNTDNNIIPYANKKSKASILEQSSVIGNGYKVVEPDLTLEVAEEEIKYLTEENKRKKISDIRRAMEKAAKDLNFMEAARLRDELKKFNK